MVIRLAQHGCCLDAVRVWGCALVEGLRGIGLAAERIQRLCCLPNLNVVACGPSFAREMDRVESTKTSTAYDDSEELFQAVSGISGSMFETWPF